MAIRTLATRKPPRWAMEVSTTGAGLQTFTLPDLHYDYGGLEPAISGEIMQLHHQKHHHTYITNYNKALEHLDDAIAKSDASAAVKLQSAMAEEGGVEPPHGSLGWAIDQHFGSITQKVLLCSVQGSGWVVV